MKRKQNQFRDGDKVIVAYANHPKQTFEASVTSVHAGTLILAFLTTDNWYAQSERLRGIFKSEGSATRVPMFLDHEGTWTSTYDMKQYAITLKP